MNNAITIERRCCLHCGHIYCGRIACPVPECDGLGEPILTTAQQGKERTDANLYQPNSNR